MSYPLVRERIADGVYFSSITDRKFKHNRMSVNLVVKLDREKVTNRAVVPFILRQGWMRESTSWANIRLLRWASLGWTAGLPWSRRTWFGSALLCWQIFCLSQILQMVNSTKKIQNWRNSTSSKPSIRKSTTSAAMR